MTHYLGFYSKVLHVGHHRCLAAMKPESVDKTRVKRKKLLRLQIIGHHHFEPGNIILEGSWLRQEAGSEKTRELSKRYHDAPAAASSGLAARYLLSERLQERTLPTDEGRSWSYALWHANLAPLYDLCPGTTQHQSTSFSQGHCVLSKPGSTTSTSQLLGGLHHTYLPRSQPPQGRLETQV